MISHMDYCFLPAIHGGRPIARNCLCGKTGGEKDRYNRHYSIQPRFLNMPILILIRLAHIRSNALGYLGRLHRWNRNCTHAVHIS